MKSICEDIRDYSLKTRPNKQLIVKNNLGYGIILSNNLKINKALVDSGVGDPEMEDDGCWYLGFSAPLVSFCKSGLTH
jgi:hypothetical protein